MRRRQFIGATASLAACAAGMVPSPAFAAEIGVAGSWALMDEIQALRGIEEGTGTGRIDILYSPWCHAMPDLYRETRHHVGQVRLNWIPFSGGQPEGRAMTEELLTSGQAAAIPATFVRIKGHPGVMAAPLSDAQDLAVAAMTRRYIREIGMGIGNPTLFYRMAGNRPRVVRGNPVPETLAMIVGLAT